MVADADPVSAGAVDVSYDRMFSLKPGQLTAEVMFYPRLNAASLEFKYESVTYRQFWDENGRQQFAAALERYKADYEARNLIDRPKRTRAVYGKFKGRVEWETFKLTRTRIASPTFEIGYRFKDGSPYFATLMRSAKEENAMGGDNPTESQQISLYFTRAQADDLARLFNQSYLMWLLGGKEDDRQNNTFVPDDYNKAGD